MVLLFKRNLLSRTFAEYHLCLTILQNKIKFWEDFFGQAVRSETV